MEKKIIAFAFVLILALKIDIYANPFEDVLAIMDSTEIFTKPLKWKYLSFEERIKIAKSKPGNGRDLPSPWIDVGSRMKIMIFDSLLPNPPRGYNLSDYISAKYNLIGEVKPEVKDHFYQIYKIMRKDQPEDSSRVHSEELTCLKKKYDSDSVEFVVFFYKPEYFCNSSVLFMSIYPIQYFRNGIIDEYKHFFYECIFICDKEFKHVLKWDGRYYNRD